MITLAEARESIGKGVVYCAVFGDKPEDGVITSVNSKYVFVRYAGDQNSKATSPEDLEFLFKEKT